MTEVPNLFRIVKADKWLDYCVKPKENKMEATTIVENISIVPALPGYLVTMYARGDDAKMLLDLADMPDKQIFEPIVAWQIVTYRFSDDDCCEVKSQISPISVTRSYDTNVLIIRPDGAVEDYYKTCLDLKHFVALEVLGV